MFSIRIIEWPHVGKKAVHSVNCACLLRTFINFCMCPCVSFGFECGIKLQLFLIIAFLFTFHKKI